MNPKKDKNADAQSDLQKAGKKRRLETKMAKANKRRRLEDAADKANTRRLQTVADNKANIANGTSDHMQKRKRTTNSLVAAPQKTQKETKPKVQKQSAETCAPAEAAKVGRPTQKRKRPDSYVTDFDRQRAKDLPVYMREEYVETIMDGMENDHVDDRLDDYFEGVQTDIRPNMRTILCGWMTEVAEKFEMKEVSLWHTFQLVDRYLATTDVMRQDFQLVGSAALWVASKYNEIYPPVGTDLVHMADGAFTKEELIKTEADLCEKLGYKFTDKSSFQYLERYTDMALHELSPDAAKLLQKHLETDRKSTDLPKLVKMAKRIKFLARYILERYNLTHDCVGRPVKHMAAQALYTALMLTSNDWNKALVEATGFTEADLRDENFKGGSFIKFKSVTLDFDGEQHKAIIRKYRNPALGAVSTLRKRAKQKQTE